MADRETIEKLRERMNRPKIGVKTVHPNEIAVCERLEREGWRVTNRGWPDFLAFKEGRLRFIEVKRLRRKGNGPLRLSERQQLVAEWLKTCLGVEVEVAWE